VRCEAAKARLPVELRNGLVLTVEEAKGLEFDDVCIFEFFSDSPADKEWHVLYSLLDPSLLPHGAELRRMENFDPHIHLLMMEELKMLYVSLTRARKRVFLFDSSLEKRAPAFDYLSTLGVAERGLDEQLSATASKAGKSSVQDWVVRGENFATNRLWVHAERCFLKGGDEVRALECGGRRLANTELEGQAKADKLRLAAVAFLQAAGQQQGSAASANYGRAARAYYLAAEALMDKASEVAAARFADAAHVVWRGLDAPREAAACFVKAMVMGGREVYYPKVVEALGQCKRDEEVAHAIEMLRSGRSEAAWQTLRVDKLADWLLERARASA